MVLDPFAPDLAGLRYIPNYLDVERHRRLLRILDGLAWVFPTGFKRRVQQYGYTYGYDDGIVEFLGPLPDWAESLARRLNEEQITPWVADALLVNEYEPGQGITRHVDLPRFSGTVVSVSLGSTCIMEFTHRGSTAKHLLLLEPRSALALSGAARTDWEHAIPRRKNDLWNGVKRPRSRRVSLTFRKVEDRRSGCWYTFGTLSH
jgi:alkylated DNA repair dioxygenase AlkB